MKRSYPFVLIALVAFAAGVAGYLASGDRRSAPAPAMESVSAAAVDRLLNLRLPDESGVVQDMAQWRGKVIVANFWATWCPPCRQEIPDFSAVSQALAEHPVQFVGISVDAAAKVRAFDEEFNVPYPLLIAGPELLELAAGLGNTARALPFTVIVDREGKVRHIKLGTLHRDELERRIRALLPS